MAELEAVLKGLNLAVVWKMKEIRLLTDSRAVFHWLSDALTGKARLKTKAASDLLIRRRLQLITSVADEYGLKIVVTLVPSENNKADSLTRLPNKWLKKRDDGAPVCAAVEEEMTSADSADTRSGRSPWHPTHPLLLSQSIADSVAEAGTRGGGRICDARAGESLSQCDRLCPFAFRDLAGSPRCFEHDQAAGADLL